MRARLGWSSVVLLLATGCATMEPRTVPSGAAPARPMTEEVFNLKWTYDEAGNDTTVDWAAEGKPLPIKVKEHYGDTTRVEIHDARVASGGRYIYLFLEGSPGCVYKLDPVSRRYIKVC
jgi:hypothetical protein